MPLRRVSPKGGGNAFLCGECSLPAPSLPVDPTSQSINFLIFWDYAAWSPQTVASYRVSLASELAKCEFSASTTESPTIYNDEDCGYRDLGLGLREKYKLLLSGTVKGWRFYPTCQLTS